LNWLNKLADEQAKQPRAAAGLEWRLWQKLPTLLGWGGAATLALALAFWWLSPDSPAAAQQREQLLLMYRLVGLLVLYWTLVVTLAIGCVVVMVMKGPAYVADPYPPAHRDRPE